MLGLTFCVLVFTVLMWLARIWILRPARRGDDLKALFGEDKDKDKAPKNAENAKENRRPTYTERVAEMEAKKEPPKPFLEELDDYLLKNESFLRSRQRVRRAYMDKTRKAKLDKVRRVLYPKEEQGGHD